MARKVIKTRLPEEWAWGKGMVVRSSDKSRKSCVWEPFELTDDSPQMTLRATLRIWGGSPCFLLFETPEARRAHIEEDSRRVTWLNAMNMAEVILRSTTYQSEVFVLFCPVGKFGETEELIRIYQSY